MCKQIYSDSLEWDGRVHGRKIIKNLTETFGKIDMIITLILVIVLWVYTYV